MHWIVRFLHCAVLSAFVVTMVSGCLAVHRRPLHVPPGHAKRAVHIPPGHAKKIGHVHGPGCGHVRQNGQWVAVRIKVGE